MAPGLLTAYPIFIIEAWVSGLDLSVSLWFRDHFHTAMKKFVQGIFSGRATAPIRKWQQWIDFCTEVGLDPFIKAFEYKVPILQVFIHQVRIGELVSGGNKIRSRLVEDYLRVIS